MKTFAFLIFGFVVSNVEAAKVLPSFFKLVGNYKYNDTDRGQQVVKEYYVSDLITYSWHESYLSCKANGMQMARIDSADEIKNLGRLARRNINLFRTEVYVDGKNLTANQTSSSCFSFWKLIRGKYEFREVECDGESRKFMCQNVEVVKDYEANKEETIDVKATFFTKVGDYEVKKSSKLTTAILKKTYYASFGFSATPAKAYQICESLGMKLVSPQDQAELIYLKKLIAQSDNTFKVSSSAWVISESSSNSVDYDINWDSSIGAEKCIGIQQEYNNGRTILLDCQDEHEFICEYSKKNVLTTLNDARFNGNESDRTRFLKPLSEMNFSSNSKSLFLGTYKTDWINALLVCRSFGMDLLTPDNELEDETMRSALSLLEGAPNAIHVGATSVGLENRWYAISSGKIFDYDFDWELTISDVTEKINPDMTRNAYTTTAPTTQLYDPRSRQ